MHKYSFYYADGMPIKKVLNHQFINNVQKFICNTRKEDGMMKKQDKLLSEDEFTAFTKRLSIQLIFTVLSRKLPIACWFAFEFSEFKLRHSTKKVIINSGMFYFKHCVCVTDIICKETLRSWFNLF